MIEYWRNIWYERTNSSTDPNFPFGFVQVKIFLFNDFFFASLFLQLSILFPNETTIGGFPWIRWHQTFDVGYVPNNVVPKVFMATSMNLFDKEAP